MLKNVQRRIIIHTVRARTDTACTPEENASARSTRRQKEEKEDFARRGKSLAR